MWKVNEVEMNSEFIFVKKCAAIHFAIVSWWKEQLLQPSCEYMEGRQTDANYI